MSKVSSGSLSYTTVALTRPDLQSLSRPSTSLSGRPIGTTVGSICNSQKATRRLVVLVAVGNAPHACAGKRYKRAKITTIGVVREGSGGLAPQRKWNREKYIRETEKLCLVIVKCECN